MQKLAPEPIQEFAWQAQLSQKSPMPDAHTIRLETTPGRSPSNYFEQVSDPLVGTDNHHRRRAIMSSNDVCHALNPRAIG
jgi:hypothetical protein